MQIDWCTKRMLAISLHLFFFIKRLYALGYTRVFEEFKRVYYCFRETEVKLVTDYKISLFYFIQRTNYKIFSKLQKMSKKMFIQREK